MHIAAGHAAWSDEDFWNGYIGRAGSFAIMLLTELERILSQTYENKPVTTSVFILKGIRLRRDSWVSVMYAEEPNSTTSSVTLQRTDRHEILGQKPAGFQESV